jgi:uncharacterized membrane protein
MEKKIMWIVLSMGSMLLLAAMMLLIVPPGRAGAPASVVLFYLLLMACLFNLAYLGYQGTSLRLPGSTLLWIVGAGLASFLGNFCYIAAINIAPNPGFACAIESAKAPVVMLMSIWLFTADFSTLKGLGVLCCGIGVALISL